MKIGIFLVWSKEMQDFVLFKKPDDVSEEEIYKCIEEQFFTK